MKITAIKQQIKRADRYSIYVDGKYSFSLSESALLESKLASGQELSPPEVERYKEISADDKLYNQALRYVAMRPRSRWEVEFYMERKHAAPSLVKNILNKLSILGFIDDMELAKAYIRDRRLLHPSSRRKITAELRKKHISDEIIHAVIGEDSGQEKEALGAVVAAKRRQSKYQDDLKLMQYLARQGFGYDDIKDALSKD